MKYPRLVCHRCGRTISTNGMIEIRDHFCPHREHCVEGRCANCTFFQHVKSPDNLHDRRPPH